MNLEVQKKWVNALRSGEYKQGREALKVKDTFCCLGVLCDLYSKEHNVGEWVQRDDFVDGFDYKEGDLPSANGILPTHIMLWAGLKEKNPVVSGSSRVRIERLSRKNDAGTSFSKIADIIEKEI